jgi:hypothetical protein
MLVTIATKWHGKISGKFISFNDVAFVIEISLFGHTCLKNLPLKLSSPGALSEGMPMIASFTSSSKKVPSNPCRVL